MEEKLYNLIMFQLGEIIKNNNYASIIYKEKDYLLLKYLTESIFTEKYTTKTKEKIKKALEEAFIYSNKKNIQNGIIDNYIDYLSDKIKNNRKINTFKNYKDYYDIIYYIFSELKINSQIIDIRQQEEIVRVTVEEEKAREEFIKILFNDNISLSDRKILKTKITKDINDYFSNSNNFNYRFDLEEYKNYIETIGRKRYAAYFLYGYKNEFYLLFNYPHKPNIEINYEKYFISLLMDSFMTYKTNQNKISTAIEIINLDENEIIQNKKLLKYAIEEKYISQIKRVYDALSRYNKNNQLLSKIGKEPFHQDEHNKSILEINRIQMKEAAEKNDMWPLGDINTNKLPTKTKISIQKEWVGIIIESLYPKYKLWLDDEANELYTKVYQANKINFEKIIYDFKTNDNMYTPEQLNNKLKKSVQNTTYKVVEENIDLFYNKINTETLKKLDLKNQQEKEFSLIVIKELLSGKTKHGIYVEKIPEKEYKNIDIEVKNRIINEIYNLTYTSTNKMNQKQNYIPEINEKPIINNRNYQSLLRDNKNLLEELRTLTSDTLLDLVQLSDMKNDYSLYLDGYRYKENQSNDKSEYDKILKHIIDELGLKSMIEPSIFLFLLEDAISIEQKKYDFLTFIDEYFNFISLNVNTQVNMAKKNEIIECFYNKYSEIMNAINEREIEDKMREDFMDYFTFGAQNYIIMNIQIKHLNLFDIDNFNNYLESIKEEYLKEKFSEDNATPKKLVKKIIGEE